MAPPTAVHAANASGHVRRDGGVTDDIALPAGCCSPPSQRDWEMGGRWTQLNKRPV